MTIATTAAMAHAGRDVGGIREIDLDWGQSLEIDLDESSSPAPDSTPRLGAFEKRFASPWRSRLAAFFGQGRERSRSLAVNLGHGAGASTAFRLSRSKPGTGG